MTWNVERAADVIYFTSEIEENSTKNFIWRLFDKSKTFSNSENVLIKKKKVFRGQKKNSITGNKSQPETITILYLSTSVRFLEWSSFV